MKMQWFYIRKIFKIAIGAITFKKKISKTKLYSCAQRYILFLTESKENLSCESKYNFLWKMVINIHKQTGGGGGGANQSQILNSFLYIFYQTKQTVFVSFILIETEWVVFSILKLFKHTWRRIHSFKT